MRSHVFRHLARLASAFSILLAASATFAASPRNWPGWRGLTGIGLTDEKDLPLKWDGKTGENVLWKLDMKGTTGHSSPIVWGDRVFVTTAGKQTNQQEAAKEIPEHHLWCISAGDGKVLWKTPIEPGKQPAGYAIYAVPTPVTDGKAIYCWFGSSMMAAVDFDGKVLWRQEREPGQPNDFNPGICTSPVLYDGTILLFSERGHDRGWLQAIDPATGNVKWEKKRPKMSPCNSTPIFMKVAGHDEMIFQASRELEGLDPMTGDILWTCKAKGFGSSPIYGSGLVFSDSGNGQSGLVVDPAGKGDLTATNIKWQVDKIPSQYASGIIASDNVYRASDKGDITAWKLATGEQLFSEKCEGVSKLSSPFATSDGRIYFTSSNISYVLKAGPKFEVLAKNKLEGGDNAASAAVSNGKIFIRGNQVLYCIGAK